MLKKNWAVIILVAFLLLNITSFFDGTFESIFNLVLSIAFIVMLYLFISKRDVLEKLEGKNKAESEKMIRYMCMGIIPGFTLLGVFLYPGNILNYLILLSIQGVIYFLFRNIKLACIIQIVFSYVLYVTTEILTIVRGTPFMPVDILSINLGFSLSGNYGFSISSNLLRGTIAAFFLIFVVTKLVKESNDKKEKRKVSLVSLSIFLLTFVSVWAIDETTFNNRLFSVADSIRSNGMILNFCVNMKYLNLEEPEGYSKEYAEEILNSYSEDTLSGDAELPNIIVVMSESFADLEKVMDLNTNINPLEYFYSLNENTVRGNLVVPIIGSLTSISEMEFLTGFSIEFFKENSVPYMQYITKKTNSIVWDLKELGYNTFAMHPFYEHAYKRNYVYEHFGFDDFISIEDLVSNKELKGYKYIGNIRNVGQNSDWKELDRVRDYVSDRANFEKIIEIYENSPGKTFIFNATMQNHASYNYEGEDFETTVIDKNINNAEMNQYLSLLHESDKALEEFINYFEENSSEKTIILFFGDHYPWLRSAYDAALPKNEAGEWTKETYVELTTVPFFIWANYDIEEKNVDKISMQYLSVLLKETAGIPLTSWDKYRKETMKRYPAFNFVGTYNSSGELLDNANILDDSYFEKYKILQYYFLKNDLENAEQ